MHGLEIINEAFAKNGGVVPSSGGDKAGAEVAAAETPSPEILIHLTNAGIVLPASSKYPPTPAQPFL